VPVIPLVFLLRQLSKEREIIRIIEKQRIGLAFIKLCVIISSLSWPCCDYGLATGIFDM